MNSEDVEKATVNSVANAKAGEIRILLVIPNDRGCLNGTVVIRRVLLKQIVGKGSVNRGPA